MTDQPLKACVFCGQPPEKKTREHVIPKWLIKLAKAQNEDVFFVHDEGHSLTLKGQASESLWFGACGKCNHAFAELEAIAGRVTESLISGGEVSYGELSLFMDWLDKVRVGLWRGTLQRIKNRHDLLPRFAIASRILAHDRITKVVFLDGDDDGYQIIGTVNGAFLRAPSCFGLRVRNLLIVNVSAASIVSKWVGLPYVSYAAAQKDRRVSLWIEPGTQTYEQPEILKFLRLPGLTMLQPSMVGLLGGGMDPSFLNNPHAQGILEGKEFGGVQILGIDKRFESDANKLVPRHAIQMLPNEEGPVAGATEVLRIQLYLQRFRTGGGDVDPAYKARFEESFDRDTDQLVRQIMDLNRVTSRNRTMFADLVGRDGLVPNEFGNGPVGIRLPR